MTFLINEVTKQRRQIDKLDRQVEEFEEKIEQMKEADMNLKKKRKNQFLRDNGVSYGQTADR